VDQVLHARLVCLDDKLDETLKDLEIELSDHEQTVGRAPENTICVQHRKVSRNHARIFPSHGGWAIEDLDSINGIFVNEERVTRTRLGHGDIIRLGPIPFRYEQDQPTLTYTSDIGASSLQDREITTVMGQNGAGSNAHSYIRSSKAQPNKVSARSERAPRSKENKAAHTLRDRHVLLRYTFATLIALGFVVLTYSLLTRFLG
jgi:predicted component of type VI protein secretion system